MKAILIVDDISINRKLIKAVISKNMTELNFYEASDGVQALEIIYHNQVDLIFLDLLMPKLDGFGFLKEIKSSDRYSNIPVIVSSAIDEIEYVKKALELGADDYFTKPFTSEQIEFILPLKVKNALKEVEHIRTIMELNSMMQEEMELANIFQHMIINNTKELKTAQMYGDYLPASKVGGDFFDCIENQDGLWFIIADVSGHGVAASMISSMVKVMFENYIKLEKTPAGVIKRMNDFFCDSIKDNLYFSFTAFIGNIKNNCLTFCNAGHPYPLVYKAVSKDFFVIEENGFIVGIMKEAEYFQMQTEVAAGDFIILYSDGFQNNADDDQLTVRAWVKQLIGFMNKLDMNLMTAEDTVWKIKQNFLKCQGKRCSDDTSIMVLKIL